MALHQSVSMSMQICRFFLNCICRAAKILKKQKFFGWDFFTYTFTAFTAAVHAATVLKFMEYLDLYGVEFSSTRKRKYKQFSAVLLFHFWAVNPLCFLA